MQEKESPKKPLSFGDFLTTKYPDQPDGLIAKRAKKRKLDEALQPRDGSAFTHPSSRKAYRATGDAEESGHTSDEYRALHAEAATAHRKAAVKMNLLGQSSKASVHRDMVRYHSEMVGDH